MNVTDYLSTDELKMIDAYRHLYAAKDKMNSETIVPIENVLNIWKREKDTFLFNIFNNKTILEKKITCTLPATRLYEEMSNLVYHHDGDKISSFLSSLNLKINELVSMLPNETKASVKVSLYEFTSPVRLLENSVPYKIVVPETIKYKKMVFDEGMSIIKALKVLCKNFNLITEEFEAFRQAHSQILNRKFLKGTLCLSIHPLDYMTMSDNDNNWQSCMSWTHEGCYRQGTVEMMNSPYVVVGYIKSDTNNFIRPEVEWSNKKWRCLYLVHPNYISSIKEYPYQLSEANIACLNWLKELVEKNTKYKYTNGYFTLPQLDEDEDKFNDLFFDNYDDEYTPYFQVDLFGQFNPRTDVMYNDFGRTTHKIYPNIENNTFNTYYINYSGPRQCMCCGKILDDFCDEYALHECDSRLVCSSCDTIKYCERCGDEIHLGEKYYVIKNEEIVCPHCYKNYCVKNSFTGEAIMLDYHTNYYSVLAEDNTYLFSIAFDNSDRNITNMFYDIEGASTEIQSNDTKVMYQKIIHTSDINKKLWKILLHKSQITEQDKEKFIMKFYSNDIKCNIEKGSYFFSTYRAQFRNKITGDPASTFVYEI